jgi:hypothetical protein
MHLQGETKKIKETITIKIMEANELRVTNFVMSDGIEMPVAMIGIDAVQLFTPQGNTVQSRLDLIKPIELTEEWLKRFGFEKQQPYYDYEFRLERYTVTFSGRFGMWELWKDGAEDTSTHIKSFKYLHEFQNLLFALTGEELKTK